MVMLIGIPVRSTGGGLHGHFPQRREGGTQFIASAVAMHGQ